MTRSRNYGAGVRRWADETRARRNDIDNLSASMFACRYSTFCVWQLDDFDTVPLELHRAEHPGLSMYLCVTTGYYFEPPTTPTPFTTSNDTFADRCLLFGITLRRVNCNFRGFKSNNRRLPTVDRFSRNFAQILFMQQILTQENRALSSVLLLLILDNKWNIAVSEPTV